MPVVFRKSVHQNLQSPDQVVPVAGNAGSGQLLARMTPRGTYFIAVDASRADQPVGVNGPLRRPSRPYFTPYQGLQAMYWCTVVCVEVRLHAAEILHKLYMAHRLGRRQRRRCAVGGISPSGE
jgi:hypothetical protein